ncbi:MAG TPA: hypothetical protein VH234_01070 [Candidatus Saccharimonadales bacterium]|jgi:hypothetical protein|nr:hypothetical protein [Candidatus Saccharimonadales bacterium]
MTDPEILGNFTDAELEDIAQQYPVGFSIGIDTAMKITRLHVATGEPLVDVSPDSRAVQAGLNKLALDPRLEYLSEAEMTVAGIGFMAVLVEYAENAQKVLTEGRKPQTS